MQVGHCSLPLRSRSSKPRQSDGAAAIATAACQRWGSSSAPVAARRSLENPCERPRLVRRTTLFQQEQDYVVVSCHHDTSWIAWAKLLAWVGEAFPLACPNCGGDIWLISFIANPIPMRKIPTLLGEPLEPPHVISRNGNFLVNLGPQADGTIPKPQADRLRALESGWPSTARRSMAVTPGSSAARMTSSSPSPPVEKPCT